MGMASILKHVYVMLADSGSDNPSDVRIYALNQHLIFDPIFFCCYIQYLDFLFMLN